MFSTVTTFFYVPQDRRVAWVRMGAPLPCTLVVRGRLSSEIKIGMGDCQDNFRHH